MTTTIQLNINSNKSNIFFVTSLPRTGTTSLCKMAEICGLKPIHVLYSKEYFELLCDYIDNGYNFFADTPFYNHFILNGLFETNLIKQYNIKFIYSTRHYTDWKLSFDNMIKKWRPQQLKQDFNKTQFFDYVNYEYIKEYYFDTSKHLHIIKLLSQLYKIELLEYNFDSGWQSFCNFIGCDIPTTNIPHMNKNNETK